MPVASGAAAASALPACDAQVAGVAGAAVAAVGGIAFAICGGGKKAQPQDAEIIEGRWIDIMRREEQHIIRHGKIQFAGDPEWLPYKLNKGILTVDLRSGIKLKATVDIDKRAESKEARLATLEINWDAGPNGGPCSWIRSPDSTIPSTRVKLTMPPDTRTTVQWVALQGNVLWICRGQPGNSEVVDKVATTAVYLKGAELVESKPKNALAIRRLDPSGPESVRMQFESQETCDDWRKMLEQAVGRAALPDAIEGFISGANTPVGGSLTPPVPFSPAPGGYSPGGARGSPGGTMVYPPPPTQTNQYYNGGSNDMRPPTPPYSREQGSYGQAPAWAYQQQSSVSPRQVQAQQYAAFPRSTTPPRTVSPRGGIPPPAGYSPTASIPRNPYEQRQFAQNHLAAARGASPRNAQGEMYSPSNSGALTPQSQQLRLAAGSFPNLVKQLDMAEAQAKALSEVLQKNNRSPTPPASGDLGFATRTLPSSGMRTPPSSLPSSQPPPALTDPAPVSDARFHPRKSEASRIFESLDTNRDGTVSLEEFRRGYSSGVVASGNTPRTELRNVR